MQDPAQVAALGLTQGFRDGTMRHVWAQVVSGTAMEAWMKQAAAKQLHVPSRQKRWDFIDEAAQQKRGYSAAQVSAQRAAFAAAVTCDCHSTATGRWQRPTCSMAAS